MPTTRTDQVAVDGGAFDLHVWLPESGTGPGVLLIQEIFGVGAYIRAVGERLAALGYVVGAPDVFCLADPEQQIFDPESTRLASDPVRPPRRLAASCAGHPAERWKKRT
jgi:dienelactone hydrolase